MNDDPHGSAPAAAGAAGGGPLLPGAAGLDSRAIAGLGLWSADPAVAGQRSADDAPTVSGWLQPSDGLAPLMAATLEQARQLRAIRSRPQVVYQAFIPPLEFHARDAWGYRECVARYAGSHADLPDTDPPADTLRARWSVATGGDGRPMPAAAGHRSPAAAPPAMALFQAPAPPAPVPVPSGPVTPGPVTPATPGPAPSPGAAPPAGPLSRALAPAAGETAEGLEMGGALEVGGALEMVGVTVGTLLLGGAAFIGGMLVPSNWKTGTRSASVQGHPELDAQVTIPPGSFYAAGPVPIRRHGPGGTVTEIGSLQPDLQGDLHDGEGGPVLATLGSDGIVRLSADGEGRFGGPPAPPPTRVHDPRTGTVYVINDARESEIVTGGIAQGWPPSRIQQALDDHRSSRRPATAAGGAAPPPDQGTTAPPSPAPPPRTAPRLVRDASDHGDSSHGPDTRPEQHTHRVLTGIAPDGRRSGTLTSTWFYSEEAKRDGIERAWRKLEADDAAGRQDRFTTKKNGKSVPATVPIVVTGFPGGYGSGVFLPKPINRTQTVVPTGNLPNALVVFKWNPTIGAWNLRSYYPSSKQITR